MSQIRRPLVGLLALFAGAITIDRAGDAGGEAIATWVYLFAAAAVAAPLLAGGPRRARPCLTLSTVLGAYLFIRLLTAGTGGQALDPYLSATEAAFLACAALLGRKVAVGLREIDETIGAVAFGENPALDLDGPRATNEILSEMARSRRHDRPLSVTVLEPSTAGLEIAVDRAAEDVQRALRRRFVYGRLARVIADQLRRSDLLFEHRESGRFIVLSPETEHDGTALLVTRIRQAARSLELDLVSGSATFPDQAVTFEQLILEAERRLGSAPSDRALRPVAEPAGGTP
jgi:hypothetical protein